jgi:hypothetical protein
MPGVHPRLMAPPNFSWARARPGPRSAGRSNELATDHPQFSAWMRGAVLSPTRLRARWEHMLLQLRREFTSGWQVSEYEWFVCLRQTWLAR